MTTTDVSVKADNTQELVNSLLPFQDNPNKAKYISYRASGFSFREACDMAGIHEATVKHWREVDTDFILIEAELPELRKTLGLEYAHLEFMRNYRLILEKDFRVIQKSVKNPDAMTLGEQQYLLKARGHYTPQQLEVLHRLMGLTKPSASDKPFDFGGFLMSMSRTTTTESITLEKK